MAVSKRQSRKIIIENIEFRWRVTGNDGYITVVIWPVDRDVVRLTGTFDYHSEYAKEADDKGCYNRTKGQIIITNRIIRKIIKQVSVDKIENLKGQIDLGHLEDIYDINEAHREPIDSDK